MQSHVQAHRHRSALRGPAQAVHGLAYCKQVYLCICNSACWTQSRGRVVLSYSTYMNMAKKCLHRCHSKVDFALMR